MEGSKKRGRKEREISVTIGSFLTEHGVEWMVKEVVMCESCEKKEKKCFWRMEARQGKACLACHNLKKSCSARAEELEVDAGPLKKRRVEGKGKVVTPNSRVAESVTTDVLWDILKELKGLCAEVGDLHAFSQCMTSMVENGWRMQQQISVCINDLHRHFMPEDDDEGSVRVGAGDKEDGGDGAENEEMCDAKMEESGADMVDNAMDETLH